MQLRLPNIKLIGFLFLATIIFSQPSWAGRVVKVKGKKVYIKLSRDEVDGVEKGDKLYITTKSGKKKGIVVIRNMKGRKVIAKLGKGKAKRGMYTKLRKAKKKAMADNKEDRVEDPEEVAQTEVENPEHSHIMVGLVGAFGNATQNVTDVADMSGSYTGFKAAFDYTLFGGLGVKALAGMDSLSVTGINAASQEFTTDISYLTIEFLLRYNMMFGSMFGAYGNVGMGIFSPMSTELGDPAALAEDSISTTSLAIFGAGGLLQFSSWQITFGADYYYFPPSDDVDTSVIAGKVGIMFEL